MSKATSDDKKGEVATATQASNHDFWETMWSTSKTGWDAGSAHPTLLNALRHHEKILFPSGTQSSWTVLVPGCGRGYDVAAFAAYKPGITATGLDISPSGIAAAEKHLRTVLHAPTDTARVLQADFFTHEPSHGYDVIYDFTFLCALSRELRADWGAQVARLVRKGGHIVCGMFPLREADERGPPYALSVKVYEELLEEGGMWERVEVWDVKEEEQTDFMRKFEAMAGSCKFGIWKRV
ncbi:S-adenosyl-L-methionine-dependent methyltransferase [Chytriomyces sp. MP71]|nr:S-adenosyl-L-methionine-dependent methyltransferase [Chytriomyces sp. MP71]